MIATIRNIAGKVRRRRQHRRMTLTPEQVQRIQVEFGGATVSTVNVARAERRSYELADREGEAL